MTSHLGLIATLAAESTRVKSAFFRENAEKIAEAATLLVTTFRSGHKVLLFGNGGSASDAQHIATEFVGRFMPNRRALPALSLAADVAEMTALANDFGYEAVFSRQIEALGVSGDVAIGISTSGNSANVLRALDAAQKAGLRTLGFTGAGGGKMLGHAEILFCVPSTVTPRIQETHITLAHILCEIVDREMFPEAWTND